MFFERVYEAGLAQASYLIGCQATGEAVVVDPRRDVEVYLELAEANGLRIVAVTETHIHADYRSGVRELAGATGAKLYLSGEGGEGWRYAFGDRELRDGDEISVGKVRLRAIHTPGHTPEHLSFLVVDGAASEEPGMVLTGDFVFVGDLGRPDLLEAAAGEKDTSVAGARQMYRSLREKFMVLPDWVQVWPGHGAGSACGKSLGSVPVSTVGYEKRTAWWFRYVQSGDEEGFVEALLADQPDAPAYFGRMKRENRDGAEVLTSLDPPRELDARELGRMLEREEALVLDARPLDAPEGEKIAQGALRVPFGDNFSAWAAWVIDPERDGRSVVLLAGSAGEAGELRKRLLRVGIDRVAGFVRSLDALREAGLPVEEREAVPAGELDDLEGACVLDVRSEEEHAGGAVPDSLRVPGGRVMWELEKLPESETLVTYCRSGARSAVVASALRAEGYRVLELEGGYAAYEKERSGSAPAERR